MALAMAKGKVEFQSTLPQGERLRTPPDCQMEPNFNPRSHKGSDVAVSSVGCMNSKISIHAPTRGATTDFFPRYFPYGNFNPRSHKGSDNIALDMSIAALISIHAPTRGATGCLFLRRPSKKYFNPRSHKGSDCGGKVSFTAEQDFNPRSHKGSDPSANRSKVIVSNFNPRSHKGSDKMEKTGACQ